MGETSQEVPDESQEGTGDDSVVPGSNDDRGDRKMGIKEIKMSIQDCLADSVWDDTLRRLDEQRAKFHQDMEKSDRRLRAIKKMFELDKFD